MRKIDLMYAKFGKGQGTCKECSNYISGLYKDRSYRKCEVYGVTRSEASDWKASYQACGMKNSLWTGRNIIECVTPEKSVLVQLAGQTELFGKDIDIVIFDETTFAVSTDLSIEPDLTYCAGKYLKRGKVNEQ